MLLFDAPHNYQINFQSAGGPIMEEIIYFHNYVFIFLTFMLGMVTWAVINILIEFSSKKRYISHKFMNHGTWLEIIWTLIPAIVLVFIALPSIRLLYLADEVIDPSITVKVTGRQWYWSYEYSDYATQDGTSINFDSYTLPDTDLVSGQFRLFDVDNNLVLPVNTHVRVIITAADVIHSWAVPSLGIKLDAVPGRLNQVGLLAYREGLYYGACSELCGSAHSGMAIAVEIVDLDTYCERIKAMLEEARE